LHLRIVLDAGDCRAWLVDFARRVEAAGHVLSFELRSGVLCSKTPAETILDLERKLYTLDGRAPWTPLSPQELGSAAGEPDRILDLSRANPDGLSLWIAGDDGVQHLPRALMTRAPFALALRDAKGQVLAQAVPAIADPDSLWRALEVTLARLATLVVRTLQGGPPMMALTPPVPAKAPGPARFFAASFARKLAGRFFPRSMRRDHWRIGIRPRVPGNALPAFTLEGFRWLEDDGQGYFADPALVERDGRTWLFMERYCYARWLGEIWVVELDDTGRPVDAPRTVLVREGHLSFPVVFDHEGETYLTVENAGEGHVPLYRARRFPDQWEEVPPLLGEPLHDPVLFPHGGRYWLLGSLERDGGSACDALGAFSAPSPLGPFVPDPANPLMLDARYARAGGLMFDVGGKPCRVMQDCCTGYGNFLSFATLDQLDDQGIRLGSVAEWRPPRGLGISGMHSYTRSSRFEAIDILTPRDWKPV